MNYVLMFAPWIVFGLLPSDKWQWGALAALAVAVAVIVRNMRAGTPADALIIEFGTAAYFVVLTGIAFTDPDSGVHPYSAALSNGVLAVIAGVSLAVGKPFTLGIAKRSAPPEVWNRKPFIRINTVITSVWTAAFAISAIALAFVTHAGDGHSTGATLIQVAGFVVPMMFTVRYVAAQQRKAHPAASR
jgi:hypothetical protein